MKAHHLVSTGRGEDGLHTCMDCGAHTEGPLLPALPCLAECPNPDGHDHLAGDTPARWKCEYGFEHDAPHNAEMCARRAVFG